ncbi:expressed unknown protein [Seminavis robusta]|uniref:Uncharacterized protein n=1 Tax=Seminavis robusta TaxID=568900 RepID=A0A9N8EG78_9STRA|nr:expressed unknown protein [Seminavis robusta]|eukprot:Sro1078_g238790.1 n/a (501) ;mRNA; r:24517-26125
MPPIAASSRGGGMMSLNSGMMSSSSSGGGSAFGSASAFDGDGKKTKSRNNFFNGLFSHRPRRQQQQQESQPSDGWMSLLQEDLRGMVMKLSRHAAPHDPSMIHAASFVGSVVLLCVVMFAVIWKLSSKKNPSKEQQQRPVMTPSQQQEYESLILALQEELQAKSVHETEQAIRWRHEKKILQSRMEQMVHRQHASRAFVGRDDEDEEETTADYNNISSTAALQNLHDQVRALTTLSREQAQQLDSKQHQIEKLQNVMEEMQQQLGGGTTEAETHNKNWSIVSTDDDDDDNDHQPHHEEMDGTSHDQIVQRLLSNIARQPNHVQEELELQLSKRRLSKQSHSTPLTTLEDDANHHHFDIDTDDSSDASSVGSTSDVLSDASSSDEEPIVDDKNTLANNNKLVLLQSTMPGNLQVSMHQSRLEAIFRHGLKLSTDCLEILDGCNPELHQLRSDLFRISGLHAVYPQVFLIEGGSDIQFLGDFETVLELHDSRQLPERIGLVL